MYIEMSELLPDYLSSAEFNTGNQSTSSKSRPHEVSNIMNWIQCLASIMAIISCHTPHKVADLIAIKHIYPSKLSEGSLGCL